MSEVHGILRRRNSFDGSSSFGRSSSSTFFPDEDPSDFANKVIDGMEAVDRTYRTVSGAAGAKMRAQLQDYIASRGGSPRRRGRGGLVSSKGQPNKSFRRFGSGAGFGTPSLLSRIFGSVSGTAGEKLEAELARRLDLGSPSLRPQRPGVRVPARFLSSNSKAGAANRRESLQSIFLRPGSDRNKPGLELAPASMHGPDGPDGLRYATPGSATAHWVGDEDEVTVTPPGSPSSSYRCCRSPAVIGYDSKGIITFCNASAQKLICGSDAAGAGGSVEGSPVESLLSASFMKHHSRAEARRCFGLSPPQGNGSVSARAAAKDTKSNETKSSVDDDEKGMKARKMEKMENEVDTFPMESLVRIHVALAPFTPSATTATALSSTPSTLTSSSESTSVASSSTVSSSASSSSSASTSASSNDVWVLLHVERGSSNPPNFVCVCTRITDEEAYARLDPSSSLLSPLEEVNHADLRGVHPLHDKGRARVALQSSAQTEWAGVGARRNLIMSPRRGQSDDALLRFRKAPTRPMLVQLKEFRPLSGSSFGAFNGQSSGYWFETARWRFGKEEDMLAHHLRMETPDNLAVQGSALKLYSMVELKKLLRRVHR